MKGYAYKREGHAGVYYYNGLGQLHRTDGPAIEYFGGDKSWWINGKKLTKQEFKHRATPLYKILYG